MATPDGLMEKEEGAAKDEKIKCAE